jgi:hypothetical protein
MKTRTLLPLLAALIMTPASAGDWTFTVTPYVWATDVGVNASINDRQVVDTTIDVKDLAEDLDSTFQLHTEAQNEMNGVLFDVFYVSLSEDAKTVSIPNVPDATALFNTQIGMTIYELGGIYDPKGDKEGFAMLYGTRILDQRFDVDTQIALDPAAPLAKRWYTRDTFYDGLVGVRYTKRFGKGWSTSVRADVSAGGTQFTWNANTTLAYAFGKKQQYAITGGYRRMDVDFKEENSVESDMSLSGPVVGFRFSF